MSSTVKWYQKVNDNGDIETSSMRIMVMIYFFIVALPCSLFIVYSTFDDWMNNNFKTIQVLNTLVLFLVVNVGWIAPKILSQQLENIVTKFSKS